MGYSTKIWLTIYPEKAAQFVQNYREYVNEVKLLKSFYNNVNPFIKIDTLTKIVCIQELRRKL